MSASMTHVLCCDVLFCVVLAFSDEELSEFGLPFLGQAAQGGYAAACTRLNGYFAFICVTAFLLTRVMV